MLLARPNRQGAQGRDEGRDELLSVGTRFSTWRLGAYWMRRVNSLTTPGEQPRKMGKPEQSGGAPRRAARSGSESCRARHIRTGAELAPGNEATWRALSDPDQRPPQPRTLIPADLLESRAGPDVCLGPTSVAAALRDARRGGAADLSGMRAEHLKLLLQNVPALELLAYASTRLGNTQVPAHIAAGLAMALLTARQQPGGGVRGIATVDVFRRLVSRALALLTTPYAHTSSRCRRGLAPVHWRLMCAPRWSCSRTWCWCHRMGATQMIACVGRPSSANCSFARPTCSFWCACFMAALRPFVGGTQMGLQGHRPGRGLRSGRPTGPNPLRSGAAPCPVQRSLNAPSRRPHGGFP